MSDNIEFDSDYMYIIYHDGETEVDLKDVFYISPVSNFFDTNRLGKIKYRYEGSDYYARFSPRYFSSSFKKFKNAVLEKNPNVTIEGYYPPSFFDN